MKNSTQYHLECCVVVAISLAINLSFGTVMDMATITVLVIVYGLGRVLDLLAEKKA